MSASQRNFKCPDCKHRTLKITQSLELGPDHRSDERTIQTIACSGCGFKGIAVYEESRRGSFNSESWHHDGYKVPIEVFEEVLRAIKGNIKGINPSSYTSKSVGSFHMEF